MKNINTHSGLSSKVPLLNGRIVLTEGVEKVDDNIDMVAAFIGWRRVYVQDFCVKVSWLAQSPKSRIASLRPYLNNIFATVIQKYCPRVIHAATLPTINQQDRKVVDITVLYAYNLPEVDTFVQTRVIEI